MNHSVHTFFPDKTNTKRTSIGPVKQIYWFTSTLKMASNMLKQNEITLKLTCFHFNRQTNMNIQQRFLNCGLRTPKGLQIYLRWSTKNSSLNTD